MLCRKSMVFTTLERVIWISPSADVGRADMFLGNWWEVRRRHVDMTDWQMNEWMGVLRSEVILSVSWPVSLPRSSAFILQTNGGLWSVLSSNYQVTFALERETEHGILWVIRAERSFGQRVKTMKYCLKGGRETDWENHQAAFFLTLGQLWDTR